MKTKLFFSLFALVSILSAASCQQQPDSFTVTVIEDKPAAPAEVTVSKPPQDISYAISFIPTKNCVQYFFFARSTIDNTMVSFNPVYHHISNNRYTFTLTPQEFSDLPFTKTSPYQIGVCGVSYKGVYSDIAWSDPVQP